MKNFDKLLKKIEQNYLNKDKTEKVDFHLNGEVYEVLLLTREEKADLYFSLSSCSISNPKEIFEKMKPVIYKAFQLKKLALNAHANGYIKTYYEVIDMLFEPVEINKIIAFILKSNNMGSFAKEEIEFQKK